MNQDQIKLWLSEMENIKDLLPEQVQLVTVLSRGGQGIVYRGRVNDREAAVKIYFPNQIEKRIEREVEALKTLECSNIVNLLWSGALVLNGGQVPVVATALIPGEDLEHIIERRRPDFNQMGKIAYDVANAIRVMWDRRIVHRDIKPSNILIMPNERSCVIDLGVARHLDETSLTAYGYTWGTRGYMSPEQARAERQLTCKSDVFALGVVLLEYALSRHPTNRDQNLLLARRLYQNLPEEISDWRHALLLRRMLHERPTVRPLPSEIIKDLEEYTSK